MKNFISVLFSFFCLYLGIFSSLPAQDLIVNTAVTIGADVTYDNVVVQNGGTLTVNAILTVNDDMVIESGGVVTHSLRNVPGIRLIILDSLVINSGGTINVSSRGLRGGGNGSSFGSHGETFNSQGSIVSANNYNGDASAGGSYGGYGAKGYDGYTGLFSGQVPPPYGLMENPVQLGSGGAAAGGPAKGGHGGGLVIITAAEFIINGGIYANGGNCTGSSSYPAGSGGAGGGINITANSLSGTGVIQAIGGSGYHKGGGSGTTIDDYGGGGSGGRIAIHYENNTFPVGNILASSRMTTGGTGSKNAGAAGTVFVRQISTDEIELVIDNNNQVYSTYTTNYTPMMTLLQSFKRIEVKRRGKLQFDQGGVPGPITVSSDVLISSTADFRLTQNTELNVTGSAGFDLNIESSANVYFEDGSIFSGNSIRVGGGVLNSYADLTISQPSDFELSNNGTLKMLGGGVLNTPTFDQTTFISGIVEITGGASMIVGSGDIIVGNGVTLVKDGTFGPSNSITNLTIESQGVITHSLRLQAGLVLNLTGTLEIKEGGIIDVSYRGLRGGGNGSSFGSHGETYNSQGSIVSANNYGGEQSAGGSYGGYGARGYDGYTGAFSGQTPTPYGVMENPLQLGSGGAGSGGGTRGGNGGGLVIINADQCIINGGIYANGANGIGSQSLSCGSGGAGGGINITTNSISGTGVIQAIGGSGYHKGGGSGTTIDDYGGGGSGGRIAIHYENNTFPVGNILASSKMTTGGSGSKNAGAAGTVFVRQISTDEIELVIDNNNQIYSTYTTNYTPMMTLLQSFKRIEVKRRGKLQFDQGGVPGPITVSSDVLISSTADFRLTQNTELNVTGSSGFDLNIESSANVYFEDGSIFSGNSIRVGGGVLNSYADLTISQASDFELSNNGTLKMLGSGVLNTPTFDQATFISGTVDITGGASMIVGSGDIIVGNGVTLVKDGTFGPSNSITNLTIEPQGVITHSLRFEAGLVLNLTGTLEIKEGGIIDVSYRGLRGGGNGSSFGSHGETYNSQGSIVSANNYGSDQSAGGSYGGYGARGYDGYTGAFSGQTPTPYGVMENPLQLGSGGAGSGGGTRGGNGGGFVIINANQCIINGGIYANGADGTGSPSLPCGSGGSGGGINITTNSLSGTGVIRAIGGSGYHKGGGSGTTIDDYGGGGSGGRIAINYENNTFPVGNILACSKITYGGSVGNKNAGAAGTIFLHKPSAGTKDFIIDNNSAESFSYTPLFSNYTDFNSIVTDNEAKFYLNENEISGPINVGQPITVKNNSEFKLEQNTVVNVPNPDGFDLNIESGGKVVFLEGSIFSGNAIRAGGGTLETYVDRSFEPASDFELSANGGLNIMGSATVNLPVFQAEHLISGTVFISENAKLNIASNEITIGPNVTLKKDGTIGTSNKLNNLTINNLGKLTHSSSFSDGISLKITGLFEIKSGGVVSASVFTLEEGSGSFALGAGGTMNCIKLLINASTLDSGGLIDGADISLKAEAINLVSGGVIRTNANGLKGGANGSQFGLRGEAYAEDGQTIIAGPTVGPSFSGGASHGGLGAVGLGGGDPNPIYGDKYYPSLYGAGGSSHTVTGSAPGGNGGGKVFIHSNTTFSLNGSIQSNGGSGGYHSSGGAGGSVLIFADVFNGSGSIQAKGGNGGCGSVSTQCSGSGGGGRVAIYTHSPIFPAGNITVAPGTNTGSPAQEGTIVYMDCAYEYNVAIDTILDPQQGVFPLDTVINPRVVVKNYAPTTQIFSGEFTIGTLYQDETFVNVPSGKRDTITFSPATLSVGGSYTAKCIAKKEGDTCDENNEKTVPIGVSVGDAPLIVSVSPGSGGNTGSSTVTISGDHFRNGIQAWLQDASGVMIHANYVQFINPNKLFATFNLIGATVGQYSIYVENPDSQSADLPFSFEVLGGLLGWEGEMSTNCLSSTFDPGQLLEINVYMPKALRAGNIGGFFFIEFKNTGNIDIPTPMLIVKSDEANAVNLKPLSLTPLEYVPMNEEMLHELLIELIEEGGPPNVLRGGAFGKIKIYTRSSSPYSATYRIESNGKITILTL
ncbi:MAG: hypothetical protein H6563_11685 [Lewinellaceae bacterium]|nr:hypothetical protein [Lewinellaceae bacterium]